jgi:hypothetical protein
MKDILVEFTEYGAIIHKDQKVIESKANDERCFLNPDLSKVVGVSPSFWMLNEYNKIIRCSEEEMQRRKTYHGTVVISDKPAVEKVHIGELKKEFKQKFDLNEENLKAEINRLKQEIASHQKNSEDQLKDLFHELARSKEMMNFAKDEIQEQKVINKKRFKAAISVLGGLIFALALYGLLR